MSIICGAAGRNGATHLWSCISKVFKYRLSNHGAPWLQDACSFVLFICFQNSMESNVELQQDEILALESIFGDEVVESLEESICLTFPHIDSSPFVRVVLYFPAEYPSHEPPIAEISSPILDESVIASMGAKLQEMFVPGQVVGFEWLAWVQEEWDALYSKIHGATECCELVEDDKHREDERHTSMQSPSENRDDKEASSRSTNALSWDDIYHGDILVEKKSKFQAHVASITSVDEVEGIMDVLLQNTKVHNATHNIMAYRVESDRGNLHQDFDDDGESAAGKRLLHLLQVMDRHNLIVVVSRWFGGIKLGPSRFACINNAARIAIEEFISSK